MLLLDCGASQQVKIEAIGLKKKNPFFKKKLNFYLSAYNVCPYVSAQYGKKI